MTEISTAGVDCRCRLPLQRKRAARQSPQGRRDENSFSIREREAEAGENGNGRDGGRWSRQQSGAAMLRGQSRYRVIAEISACH